MEKSTVDDVQSQTMPVDPTEQLQDTKLAQTMRNTSNKPNWFMIGIVAAVLLGLGTGYVVAAVSKGPQVVQLETATTGKTQGSTAGTPAIQVGQVFGSKDASAFKDSAEGVLLPGGIGSEGSHHLVRPGGASQNVYLTSSVMDLKMFENAKVKVFGETFKGKQAGWLMDVGRVEVEQLNAPLPDWAQKLQQTQTPSAND